MSFLNALASDGLSVGLRFYTAKLNARSSKVPSEPESGLSGCCHELQPHLKIDTIEKKSAERESFKKQEKFFTQEEMLAGREEAGRILAEQGVLGVLQSSKRDENNDTSALTESENDKINNTPDMPQGNPLTGLGGGRGLSEEDRKKIEELKRREAEIIAEVRSAVQKGVASATDVQYSYETGPDGKSYVNGIISGSGVNSIAKNASSGVIGNELGEAEKKQLEELKRRDREVRAHEQAHINAAGGNAGAPVYDYQVGPDGQRYAIGGHVDIASGGSSDPEEALKDAEMLQRAAMAPGSPSSVDMAAASRASAKASNLKAEQMAQKNYAFVADDEQDDNLGGQNDRSNFSGVIAPLDKNAKFNGSSAFMKAAYAYNAVKNSGLIFNQRTALGSI